MKTNKNKGITLVALVITIIILLILAGISIVVLSQNGLFEKTKLAKEKQENAQIEEDETLGNYEDAINSTVVGSRDTVTISKEEYEELKDAITPKEIDFQLTIPYQKLYRKEAYVIGSEVHIYIGMDCSINKNNTTIIGKVPEQYKPKKDENNFTQYANAVYLYSGSTLARVGTIMANNSGNILIANYCGSNMSQVSGSLIYRYK